MGRIFIQVPAQILDDPRMGTLSDREWREFIMSLPRYEEYDISPERISWLRVRREQTKRVFERDENVCRYCGSTARLEIDHIIPLARGGTNDLDNLQILCRHCNAKKHTR